MAKSSLHHSADRYWNVESLQHLAELFEKLIEERNGLVQYAQVDFHQRVPALKRSFEIWKKLQAQVDLCRASASPQWYQSAVTQLEEINRQFGKAMEQIQSYDVLQQQLEHIGHTYQEVLEELKGLIRMDVSQSASPQHFLCALPEIVLLHSAQLALVREQYEEAVLKWQDAQLAFFLCVGGWLKQVEDSRESQDLRTEAAFAEFLLQLRRLDSAVHGQLHGRKRKGEPSPFEALVISMQQHLARILSEVAVLPVPHQRKAKRVALERIRSRYTMQSERVLHDRVLKAHTIPAENLPASPDVNTPDIELF